MVVKEFDYNWDEDDHNNNHNNNNNDNNNLSSGAISNPYEEIPN
jgi:hypothetical protein